MSDLEQKLIQQATSMHKKIFPCAHKVNLTECFTKHEKRILFWYNTEDESTHVLMADEE